jgi:hypothetical protein
VSGLDSLSGEMRGEASYLRGTETGREIAGRIDQLPGEGQMAKFAGRFRLLPRRKVASNAEKQPTGRGPEGCVENGPAAALLVGYVSIQICAL